MSIPSYFFILLGLIIFFVAVVIIYFQVYKRHINRVLMTGKEEHTSMIPPYKVAIITTVIVLVVCIVISYFVGYVKAYRDYEDDIQALSASDIQVFYAEVKTVDEHLLVVNGIELNEAKYQGEFSYEVWGEISLVQNDMPISLSDLSEGDLVAVVLLTDKTGITDVFKIQLLG